MSYTEPSKGELRPFKAIDFKANNFILTCENSKSQIEP